MLSIIKYAKLSSTKFDYQVQSYWYWFLHYHMVILVSQQCWSLAAKCSHCSWLLNLQVTISHINCESMRPILLKYKLCYYLNSALDLGFDIESWIVALTIYWEICLSHFPYVVTLIIKQTSPSNSHCKIVPYDNTCIFAGIAIYGLSDHTTDITIEFTSKNGSRWYITPAYFPILPYMYGHSYHKIDIN